MTLYQQFRPELVRKKITEFTNTTTEELKPTQLTAPAFFQMASRGKHLRLFSQISIKEKRVILSQLESYLRFFHK